METKTQHGYLVLADISGYTSYLAGVELDHAHEILSDLIETIVNRFKSLLIISKLEGDAVLAYIPEAKVARGETLLELIENTYLAFRDRQDSMHRRTTCTCAACRAIPALDLKFFAHHGEYLLQSVAGVVELLGTDVNLAHRLMKNHLSEATGWRAYIMFTEKALDQLGLRPEGLYSQLEAYEHLGEVPTQNIDLHSRYKELTEARRVMITPGDAHETFTIDLPAPPPVVWTWLIDPQKRRQHEGSDEVRAIIRPGGRSGAGGRNHCVHGKQVIVENILDWKPFDYFTIEADIMTGVTIRITNKLEPLAGGDETRLHSHVQLQGRLPEFIRRQVCKMMGTAFGFQKQNDILKQLVSEEASRQQPTEAIAA